MILFDDIKQIDYRLEITHLRNFAESLKNLFIRYNVLSLSMWFLLGGGGSLKSKITKWIYSLKSTCICLKNDAVGRN